MKRAIKDGLKSLIGRVFHLGQHLGWDILPRHFYSEIPDIRQLKKSTSWRRPYTMHRVLGADTNDQWSFFEDTIPLSMTERLRRNDVYDAANRRNGAVGFGPAEADFFFAFISKYQPKRVLQIGAGVSTAIALQAAEDLGYPIEITCVDPFPTKFLEEADQAGEIRLVRRSAADLSYTEIERLEPGDLFFVDSTHTLGPAGEVTRIVLELLPRVKPGVFVHFHDIAFPYDYGPNVLEEFFFWHESALLHAYLAGNSSISILCAMSMLHCDNPARMRGKLPNYTPAPTRDGLKQGPGHYPMSIYLKTV